MCQRGGGVSLKLQGFCCVKTLSAPVPRLLIIEVMKSLFNVTGVFITLGLKMGATNKCILKTPVFTSITSRYPWVRVPSGGGCCVLVQPCVQPGHLRLNQGMGLRWVKGRFQTVQLSLSSM